MTITSNAYCAVLGIPVPRIESARTRPDANYHGLLLVALLERGGPLTLEEAALRYEEAGVAPAPEALASLKRCKPARPPIYRDGDHYSLDPHDDETDLWAFRLGLRPARAVPFHVVRPNSGPPRTPHQSLTVPELDEAWRDGIPNTWSAQRIAVAVLDAHDAAMAAADVLATSLRLVIVHDLHAVRVPVAPDEADAILIVDRNTVLAPSVASERLESVARECRQIAEIASGV